MLWIRRSVLVASLMLALGAGWLATLRAQVNADPPAAAPAPADGVPAPKPGPIIWPPPPPPAQLTAVEVMERMVAANGGRQANAKVCSTTIHGTVSVRRGESLAAGTFTGYAKAPNKVLKIFTLEGQGEQRQGYDGRRGWTSDREGRVHWLAGAELARQALLAQFNCLLNYEQNFAKVELLGQVTLEQKPVYQVRLTPRDTDAMTIYVDGDSFLVVAVDQLNHGPAGDQQMRVYYGDYRRVGEILVAYQIAADMAGQRTLIKFDHVSLDDPLDDAMFLPAAAMPPLPEPLPRPIPMPVPLPRPMPMPGPTDRDTSPAPAPAL